MTLCIGMGIGEQEGLDNSGLFKPFFPISLIMTIKSIVLIRVPSYLRAWHLTRYADKYLALSHGNKKKPSRACLFGSYNRIRPISVVFFALRIQVVTCHSYP